MAEGTGDSGWQRHWEMGTLFPCQCKCLQKPEWGSCMLSRSRLSPALRNLWLQQHCPANKIHLDPWISWTEIEEHFRASLNLSFTAFVSQSLSHLYKPRWEAWGGHQPHDNVTGFMESCKTVIWQLFPLATLLQQSSSAPCCAFNSWYWSQLQWFRWQSFFGTGKIVD